MENPIEVWQEVLQDPAILVYALILCGIGVGCVAILENHEKTLAALARWPRFLSWPLGALGFLSIGYLILAAVGSFFILLWVVGPVLFGGHVLWFLIKSLRD